MHTLGLLLETESQSFTKRLPTFLPLLHQCLLEHSNSQGVRGEREEGDKEDESGVDELIGGVNEEETLAPDGGCEEMESGEEGIEGEGEKEDEGETMGEGEGGMEGEEKEGEGETEDTLVEEEDKERETDRLLFSTLSTLHRMIRECDLLSLSTSGSGSLYVNMHSVWGKEDFTPLQKLLTQQT